MICVRRGNVEEREEEEEEISARRQKSERFFETHLGFGKVDEVALVLGEVLRGRLVLLAFMLVELDLVLGGELVAAVAAAAHVRHYCGHASDGRRPPGFLS